MKCIDMFYGFNHPIYREVEYSDLRNKVLYPEVVKELRKRNISFCEINSTQNTNHQFGDFKLEERVKSMKMMAPKGSITAETWQRIARSHDKVNNVVDHAMDLLNFNDEERSRFVNIGNEVVKWRALLRHSKYVRSNTESFVGIYRDNLNSDLLGITQKLENKHREYFRLAIHMPLENIRYNNIKVISSLWMRYNHTFLIKKHNFKTCNI